jgi:hypothetical protein
MATTDSPWIDEALAALGVLLEARGHEYGLIVVGGAALLLRGVIARPTKDVDVLGARSPSGGVDPLGTLPTPLAAAVADVGLAYGLAPDWRRWPAHDRHLADLLALAPTAGELRTAAAWARSHDPSSAFAQNLAAVLDHLGVEDGDAC